MMLMNNGVTTIKSILETERLIKLNINLEKINDSLEKHNELKQKELELLKYWIDFEVKKYQDNLEIRRIEKNG